MLSTIRGRVSLLMGVVILSLLAAFGVFIYATLRLQMEQTIDDSLRLSASQIAATVENENGHYRLGKGDTALTPLYKETDLVRLVSPTGKVLDQRGDASIPIIAETLDSTGNGVWVTVQPSGNSQNSGHQDAIRLFSLPVILNDQGVAYVQVGRSLESMVKTLSQLLLLLLFAGPVLVGVAMAGGYWLAGRALAPIERIRGQAAAISAADLSRRLGPHLPNDEVGRLARTFDDMLSRLDASFQRQRRFTADASHELRTPLSIIRGEVDVTLERTRTFEMYVEALTSIRAEAERMSRLVADLLMLSRSDNAQLVLHLAPVDIGDLLHNLVEQISSRSAAFGMTFTEDIPDHLSVCGDLDRLLQLFLNLLDNAISYAPGSHVSITATVDEDVVQVAVADNGPGIPPEHLPLVFERFYRVDRARSRARGGSGLGLSIAQEIAHAHGGHIQVSSTAGVGTTFFVHLPAESNGCDDQPPEIQKSHN